MGERLADRFFWKFLRICRITDAFCVLMKLSSMIVVAACTSSSFTYDLNKESNSQCLKLCYQLLIKNKSIEDTVRSFPSHETSAEYRHVDDKDREREGGRKLKIRHGDQGKK